MSLLIALFGALVVLFGAVFAAAGPKRYGTPVGLLAMFLPIAALIYFAHRDDARDRAACERRGGVLVDHRLHCVKPVTP